MELLPNQLLDLQRLTYFTGQSGSPVLRQGNDQTYTSIGAHVYGGGMHNSASVINGTYGNPYNVYITALRTAAPLTKKGVTYISAASMNDPPIPPKPLVPARPEEEGFWDVLNAVKQVGGPIAKGVISAGLPFLGAAGLPVAALANVALGVAGKLCESSMEEQESSLPTRLSKQGFADRALLGEAALTTVLNMKDDARPEGLFDMMEKAYSSLAPVIKKVAPKVLSPLMESALRITLENVAKGHQDPSVSTTRQELKQAEGGDDDVEDPATHNFMQALLAPTLVVEGEEGFFDDLGDHIRRGLKAGRPFFRTAVKGLALLDSVLPESTMEGDSTTDAFDIISKRAVMGEAALQAVMSLEADELKAEGFFDSMKTVMQKIGSTVIKTAPSVIKAVAPIVQGLMQGQESALELALPPRNAPAPGFASSGLVPPGPEAFGPPLSTKRSYGNLMTPPSRVGTLGTPQMQDQLPIFRVVANAPTASMASQPYTLERVAPMLKGSGSPDDNCDGLLWEDSKTTGDHN